MKNISFFLFAITLSGCIAIDYEPVILDSPVPAEAAEMGRCPPTLEIGKRCIAQIFANQWMSFTGILTRGVESYCVTVPSDQVWFDKGRRNTPPLGEQGGGLMRLADRRHNHPFFNLMIDVDPDVNAAGRQETAVAVTQSKQFIFASTSPGKLVLYPNDAIGPASDRGHWYRNNSGYIWVILERCDAK